MSRTAVFVDLRGHVTVRPAPVMDVDDIYLIESLSVAQAPALRMLWGFAGEINGVRVFAELEHNR